jgi:holo-[acyl-carrier protein] synthase
MADIGVDIEQISRIEAIIVRTPRFPARIYTAAERAFCEEKARPAQHYAARFCAKEAFAKALGQSFSWHDVEVMRGEAGPPTIRTYGDAAAALAGRRVKLTLSHAGDYAIAMVLIED